jgi:PhnB protein
MRLNPHLSFDGQCEAAFGFCEKCLGGKIHLMLTYEDSPLAQQTPRAWGKNILHATLAFGEQVLTGADVMEGYQKPRGFSIILEIGEAAEADRIFTTLAEGGAVLMPLQETFWALRFGEVTDQFGTPWTINCGKGTPAEK